MFKFIDSFGKGTNTQRITNTSNYAIKVIVTGSDVTNGTWEVAPKQTINVPISRSTIGELHAHVALIYENGQEYSFSFQVTPKNETDTVLVENSLVLYNGKRRGEITKMPTYPTITADNVKNALKTVFNIELTSGNKEQIAVLQSFISRATLDEIKTSMQILQVATKSTLRAEIIAELTAIFAAQ
jgi:hypothetical protein